MFIENGEFRSEGQNYEEWSAKLFIKLEQDLTKCGITNVVRRSFDREIDLSSDSQLNNNNLPSWIKQQNVPVNTYNYSINGSFNYKGVRSMVYFTLGGINIMIYQNKFSFLVFVYGVNRQSLYPMMATTGLGGISENDIISNDAIGSMNTTSTYRLIVTDYAFHIQFFNKGFLPSTQVTVCKSGDSEIINTLVPRIQVDNHPPIPGMSPTVSFGAIGEDSIYNTEKGDMLNNKFPRFDVNVGFTNFGLIGKLKGVYQIPYDVKQVGSMVSFNGELYKQISAYTGTSGSFDSILTRRLFIKC